MDFTLWTKGHQQRALTKQVVRSETFCPEVSPRVRKVACLKLAWAHTSWDSVFSPLKRQAVGSKALLKSMRQASELLLLILWTEATSSLQCTVWPLTCRRALLGSQRPGPLPARWPLPQQLPGSHTRAEAGWGGDATALHNTNVPGLPPTLVSLALPTGTSGDALLL